MHQGKENSPDKLVNTFICERGTQLIDGAFARIGVALQQSY